jgi:hypothetical protein
MGIGVSIFLLALGAILAFAVDVSVSGLDIEVIGFILMAAGLLGIVLFLTVFGPRTTRRPVVEDTVVRERTLRDRDVY